ncbi:MAG: tetratricopeptide repeat protein [Nitrospinae bacterium]|nr:tetratricopeptide repeat protein [Nitrospinota bacterium]
MSIINEALKKAERERTPIPVGIPTQLAVTHVSRPWLRIAVASLCVGAIIGGGVGIWRWRLPAPRPLSHGPQTHQPVVKATAEEVVQSRVEAAVAIHAWPTAPVQEGQPPAERMSPAPGGQPSPPPASHAAAEAAFQRAVTAEARGLWEEAIRSYQEALALKPTLREAHTNLGTLYVRQNRLTAAIEQFQAALALEPNYALARNNLGSAYLMLGQESLAAREFLAAIRSDAQYVSPYYNLGSLYARRGEVDQAISFLTRAIALQPAVLIWLREDPDFDRIRASREFQRLESVHRKERRARGEAHSFVSGEAPGSP